MYENSTIRSISKYNRKKSCKTGVTGIRVWCTCLIIVVSACLRCVSVYIASTVRPYIIVLLLSCMCITYYISGSFISYWLRRESLVNHRNSDSTTLSTHRAYNAIRCNSERINVACIAMSPNNMIDKIYKLFSRDHENICWSFHFIS